MNISLLGIDIAKSVFQLHGIDAQGKAVLKKKLSRNALVSFIANIPVCTIVMEACGGSHHWGREFKKHGHEVKLISPQFVKPFVKTNKNDAADAQAICEAASRPEMRFVAIKSKEQQDIQSLHRIRQRLIKERTALVNQIRGFLSEYGVIVSQGVNSLRKGLMGILEDGENGLSLKIRELTNELREELVALDKQIEKYEKKLEEIHKNNDICKRISKIEGIGLLSSTIMLAELGDPSVFKSGRHFAAFLGLVPKQNSSGGKNRLLGISKRGDSYIRSLLIHGARAVLKVAEKKTDSRSMWLKGLKERRGYNRASVALANKNARIIWSLIANNTEYKKAVI